MFLFGHGRLTASGVALLAAFTTLACSDNGPDDAVRWEIRAGSLGDQTPLAVPDTAEMGARFDIVVVTAGSSSCTRPVGARTVITGLEAYITPLDSVVTSATPCTADVRAFPRPVSLVFAQPGVATVRVDGSDRAVVQTIVVHPSGPQHW